MSKISPIHHIHQAAGTQFIEHAGWLLPQVINSSTADAVTVVDRSWDNKLQIEGAQAAAVIEQAFGTAPSDNGQVVLAENAAIIGRITPTRFLIISAPDAESNNRKQLAATSNNKFITVTDQSDGQGGVRVAGDGADSLLRTLCALDFNEQVFPVNTVKISSFAKVRATLWHLIDGYHIYIGRSYTEYVWRTIKQSQRNLGR